MNDKSRTEAQLVDELAAMHMRVAELGALEAGHKWVEELQK